METGVVCLGFAASSFVKPQAFAISSRGKVILWEASAGRQKSRLLSKLYNFLYRPKFIVFIKFNHKGAAHSLMIDESLENLSWEANANTLSRGRLYIRNGARIQ